MPDIKEMFSLISPCYDLLNHLLSLGLDFYWRKKMVAIASKLVSDNASLLDLASGTGDVAFEFTKLNKIKTIVSSDFCPAMLDMAKKKSKHYRKIFFTSTDGEDINFKDKSFDIVTSAFALRNIKDLKKSFHEIRRVLKDGGVTMSLEFGRPKNILFKPLFYFYLNIVLPVTGWIFSSNFEAYKYLSSSIQEFMEPEEVCNIIKNTGFKKVYYTSLTFGIVNIYIGKV